MSTLLAYDNCGTPSRSDSIAGSTPVLASVDSEPRITRSKPIWPRTAAIAAEVPSTSEPASASSTRCTALSAPIDSALRIDSVARSGPIDKMVTSPPCASASRRPSSIANSSSSLITASAASRSSVESDSLRVRSDHVSGTCFTQTTMFMTGANLPVSCQPGSASLPKRACRSHPGSRRGRLRLCYSLVATGLRLRPAAPPGRPRWRAAWPWSSARPRQVLSPGGRPPRRRPDPRHRAGLRRCG